MISLKIFSTFHCKFFASSKNSMSLCARSGRLWVKKTNICPLIGSRHSLHVFKSALCWEWLNIRSDNIIRSYKLDVFSDFEIAFSKGYVSLPHIYPWKLIMYKINYKYFKSN